MKSNTDEIRGQGGDDREHLVHSLQTEFKGKTREEIEVALEQARKGLEPEPSAVKILEGARVLLGAGSRG